MYKYKVKLRTRKIGEWCQTWIGLVTVKGILVRLDICILCLGLVLENKGKLKI